MPFDFRLTSAAACSASLFRSASALSALFLLSRSLATLAAFCTAFLGKPAATASFITASSTIPSGALIAEMTAFVKAARADGVNITRRPDRWAAGCCWGAEELWCGTATECCACAEPCC